MYSSNNWEIRTMCQLAAWDNHHPCISLGLSLYTNITHSVKGSSRSSRFVRFTVIPPFTTPRLQRIRSYSIFKSRQFVFFSITETLAESVAEPDEIRNLIEEVVYLARKINLEADSDGVQELLDSLNQELTMD
ncbi:hypothetical protein TNCV_3996241 [Trichonephila clavipes]|nr:hypothetical protein TNCV_3996241 [Trichonephila clavipes]